MPAPRIPLRERLFRKVNKSATCWLWTGYRNRDGYGTIGQGGRNAGNFLVHRAAWEMLVGKIPHSRILMHQCDNRLCVNPAHLKVGTVAENNMDMHLKRRHASGAGTHRNKLTEKQVARIRRLLGTGLINHVEIGRAFQVRRETIWKIAHHKRWTTHSAQS